MFAPLDEGAWLQHKYQHWYNGGSIEARLLHLKQDLSDIHAHQKAADFEPVSKEKLN
jgi:hypothetical protein